MVLTSESGMLPRMSLQMGRLSERSSRSSSAKASTAGSVLALKSVLVFF